MKSENRQQKQQHKPRKEEKVKIDAHISVNLWHEEFACDTRCIFDMWWDNTCEAGFFLSRFFFCDSNNRISIFSVHLLLKRCCLQHTYGPMYNIPQLLNDPHTGLFTQKKYVLYNMLYAYEERKEIFAFQIFWNSIIRNIFSWLWSLNYQFTSLICSCSLFLCAIKFRFFNCQYFFRIFQFFEEECFVKIYLATENQHLLVLIRKSIVFSSFLFHCCISLYI